MTNRAEFKKQAQSALDSAFQHTEYDGRIYDVFFWFEGEDQKFLTVPWADTSHRLVPVEKLANGAWTNAQPLPNSMAAGSANYGGTVYRGDPPSGA